MNNSKLVGILNITPDSFSDGGAYNEAESAAKQLKLVLMHQLTIPADPNKTMPINLDVTLTIIEWLKNKAHELAAQGLEPEQIILDPGIGFGKTVTQSWKLIKDAVLFTKLGYPVMYGHSRKSFLNNITDRIFSQRDPETAMISAYLANSGVDYLRVHDIEANANAIRLSKCLE